MLSRNDSSVLSGHARTASPAGDGGRGSSSGLQSPMQNKIESGHIVETSKQNCSPLRTPPTGRRGEYRAATRSGNPLLHPPLPNLRVDASNGTIVSSGVCMTCGVDPKGTPDGVPAIPSVLATELVRLERENRTLRVSPSFPPFCFFPPNLSPNLFERGSHHNRPYIFARVRSTIHADWQGGVYD